MRKLVFITPDDTVPGFALTGVSHYSVQADEVEPLLSRIMTDPDTGVAVIDERLAAAIDEEQFREMERRWFGVLLVLPTPTITERQAVEDYAERLIRKAIGYHVRLRA